MSTPLTYLFTILLPLGCASTDQAESNWAGKAILLKGGKIVKIGHTDAKGQQVYLAELKGIDYRVIKEQDGWLSVKQNGVEGWFDKADAVVLEEAADYFTGRIQANPRDAGSYARRAVAWRLKGEWDIAFKDYDEALRLAPNVATWWNNRGAAWYFKKDYDAAIKDFSEALRLDPKYVKALNNRGNAWYFKKDYDAAIKDYDEALRLDPKFLNAYNSRGNARYFKKDYDQAIKDYDEALRLDAKFIKAYIGRGVSWSGKKDFDKALKDLDDAIELDPKEASAFADRAAVWAKKKDYDRADKDFEEALRLQATSVICRDYAFFRATCPDAKFRDGQKAVEMAKKACELHDRGWHDGGYLSVLAAAFAEAGNFGQAAAHQQKALADTTVHPADRVDYEARLKLYQEGKPYRDE